MFYSLILPWLIGILLLIIIRFPDIEPQHRNIYIHDMILNFSLIFFIAPMILYTKVLHITTNENASKQNKWISIIIPFLSVTIIVLFRLLLS